MDIIDESRVTYYSLTKESELENDEIPEDFDGELNNNAPYLRGRYRCCYALIDRKLQPDPLEVVQMFDEKLFKEWSYLPSGQPAPEWAQHDCRTGILDFLETKLREPLDDDDHEEDKEQSSKLLFLVVFGAFIIGEEDERELDRKFVPASEVAIEGLEKVSELGSDAECVICLDEEVKSLACKIPCGHVYHQDCIVKWLRKSHLCPLCRYALPVDSSTDCD